MYLLIINLLFFSTVNSNPKSPKDYIWQNRIVIIQTTEPDSTWFDERLRKGLEDRKLLVFQFNDSVLISTNSKEMINSKDFIGKLKSRGKEASQWVLIGLDGGVKSSGQNLPDPKAIFEIIDAMPMRQSEIRYGTNDKIPVN
jgi:hypothetical protein